MGERRFTEQEASEILRSASAMQSSEPSVSDGAGLTLSEIQRIGKEVGIDPSFVENAASQLAFKAFPAKASRFGAKRRMVRERIIEADLDDATWEDIVAELREGFETAGTTTSVGTTREWSGGSHWTTFLVSTTAKGSRVRVWAALNQSDGILVSWLLAFMAALLASFAVGITLGSAYGAPFALMGILMTVVAIAAVTDRALAGWQNRNSRRLEATLDRVEAAATRESSVPSREGVEQREVAPQLVDLRDQ